MSRGWGINLPGRNCEFGKKRWGRTACSMGDNSAPIFSPMDLNAAYRVGECDVINTIRKLFQTNM
jgi:hypothetical protein